MLSDINISVSYHFKRLKLKNNKIFENVHRFQDVSCQQVPQSEIEYN